jgi:hypothetical protein
VANYLGRRQYLSGAPKPGSGEQRDVRIRGLRIRTLAEGGSDDHQSPKLGGEASLGSPVPVNLSMGSASIYFWVEFVCPSSYTPNMTQ